MCEIRDFGDVPLPEANNNEQCIERITEFYDVIAESALGLFQLAVTIQLLEVFAGHCRSKIQTH